MNRLITSLVTGVFFAFCVQLSAQPVVTITPQSLEVDAGQEFEVDFVVSNFNNISSMQFPIVWDPGVLEFVEVVEFNSTDLPGLNINFFGYNPAQPGKLTFLWYEPNFSGVNLADNTSIFKVKFRAVTDGTTAVAITDDPPGIEVTDPSEAQVGMTPQNATVVVGDGGSTGGAQPVQLSLTNHNINVGDQVCVQVAVNNFTDLTTLNFSVSYDPALLNFTGAANFNSQVNGLGTGAVSNPGNGVLTVEWSSATASTLGNGSTLLEFCFDATGGGTTEVGFSDNPVSIEAVQTTGTGSESLTVETAPGTVNISEGSLGGNGFEMLIGSANVQPGESFCLPIRVGDFNDIVGLQFSISYDAGLLQFDNAGNFNTSVSGLDGNSLVNPAAGTIRFSWNDNGFTGIDLPDNAILFELCFTAQSAGTASVNFSDSPLAIEVTQKVGSVDQQIITHTANGGTVTIQGDNGGGGPGFAGFGLYMEDQVVQSGEQLCIPVKVQDFNDILGMQFSINYDAAALEFVEATGFGLNGLSAGSIGNPAPGVITLVWDDPAVSGQTLADGAVLLELCFTARANNGTSTTVSFSDTPTPREFIQVQGNDEQTIQGNFRNSFVQIGDGSGGFDGFGLLIGDAMIETGAEFCVPVTVQDFNSILGMQFSLNYNSNHLEFQGAQNFGLNGLSSGSVGNPSAGSITLVWDDPAVSGQTLADGDVLFEICFRATAPNGTTTLITLGDSPTPIEFIQTDGSSETTIDDYNSKPGKITIDVGAVLSVADPAAVTDVSCYGTSTGAIDIEVTGGTGSYAYAWSYQNAATQDLSGIPAGNYSVTVTDTGSGETATASYTVGQPSAALSANIQVQPFDCGGGGQPNGSITVAVSGGSPQYNIDWSGNLTDGTMTQTGLNAGNYSFTITDANGCTFESGPIEVTQLGLEAELTPTYIGQDQPGEVTVSVNNGTAPYSFSWRGPNGYTSQDQNLTGLQRSGEYCVTISDASGCSNEFCVTVYAALAFGTVNTTGACNGTNTGRIEIDIFGGKSPYSYSWSTGATGTIVDNLAPGTYSVTVTDDKDDQISGSFEVNELPAIALDANINQVTGEMSANNGSINLTVSGGRPGYTINWDNGATGTQLNNLATGQYCVTVTDANGCAQDACFDVTFQAVPLSFTMETEPTSCAGDADGTLRLNIQGGNDPYVVKFDDGKTLNSSNGRVGRSDLPSGQVTFTVEDQNGTKESGEAMIPGATPMEITEAIVVHDTESPGCTGSIRLSISGGTPGYNVLWNSPNTGTQIINLCEGPFIPTVADANGCTQTFDAIQVNTFGVSGTVTNATCPDDPSGGVELSIAGGTKPYSFRWADSNGEMISTDRTLAEVVPGNYRVTVSESSGNNLIREFTIGTSSNLSVDVEVLTDYSGYGVSCSEASDGTLRASGANGDGSYMYEWVRGEEMVGVSATLENASPGKYEVTVIDESGCVVTEEVDLEAPPAIVLSPTIADVRCNGEANGELEVRATGGAGNGTYDFQWSNGLNGARINSLRAGSYTVTVTDALDCAIVETFEVTEPNPLQVEVEAKPASDGCNGSVRAIVTGGTAPYYYNWNLNSTDSVLTMLCPGQYFVEVSDSRGCLPDNEEPRTAGLVGDRRFPCMEASRVVTPNDDGDNESFLVNCIEEFPTNRLEVYNRWGQLVYAADNYDNSWQARKDDGTPLDEGAYYYILLYTDGNGDEQQLKGSVTILRED